MSSADDLDTTTKASIALGAALALGLVGYAAYKSGKEREPYFGALRDLLTDEEVRVLRTMALEEGLTHLAKACERALAGDTFLRRQCGAHVNEIRERMKNDRLALLQRGLFGYKPKGGLNAFSM